MSLHKLWAAVKFRSGAALWTIRETLDSWCGHVTRSTTKSLKRWQSEARKVGPSSSWKPSDHQARTFHQPSCNASTQSYLRPFDSDDHCKENWSFIPIWAGYKHSRYSILVGMHTQLKWTSATWRFQRVEGESYFLSYRVIAKPSDMLHIWKLYPCIHPHTCCIYERLPRLSYLLSYLKFSDFIDAYCYSARAQDHRGKTHDFTPHLHLILYLYCMSSTSSIACHLVASFI